MRKVISNGYIVSVSKSNIGVEIADEEYSLINKALANKPTKDGCYYKLKDGSLTWEEFEIITILEEELSELEQKAHAYDILMGVIE